MRFTEIKIGQKYKRQVFKTPADDLPIEDIVTVSSKPGGGSTFAFGNQSPPLTEFDMLVEVEFLDGSKDLVPAGELLPLDD